MTEEPAAMPTIIADHWPCAADGTPLLSEADAPEPLPLIAEEEWQAWEQMRAEDKAWQLANWDKWSKELESLFA